ncbi:LysR family transcriptional regulator [Holdemania massiliensis]|uniref:LysR family transcriptional regulator n=1 Tax=Holdemania massiliensis TaxID=1468449 RepID=UPI001F07064F|nr:LysR family transcriptional regulator [Holdemania massiliensis]MCH1940145.1 LysR family transcriptional regulator [Holdemania massiliensis]
MKLETIQLFLKVAKYRSFSIAAAKLYTTQSTISRSIHEIEEEMGCQLYQRSAHGVKLTPAGEVVKGHFQRIMEEWKLTKKEIEVFRGDYRPKLRVGYTFIGQLQYMIKSLEKKRFAYQDVDFIFQFGDSTPLLEKLRKEQLDCIVMHRPSLGVTSEFTAARIQECSMDVLVSRQNPLACKNSILIQDLIGQTEIRTSGEKNYYQSLDEAFLQVGAQPLKKEYAEAQECPYLVKLKNYVCFNPSIYNKEEEELIQLPILDWSIDYDLVFVCRKESTNPMAQKLYLLLSRQSEEEDGSAS